MPKLKLNLLNQDKILVIGRALSGKTTLIIALALLGIKRCLVYDSNNEFRNLTEFVSVSDVLDLIDKIQAGAPRIRFFSENEKDFDRVCRALMVCGQEDIFQGVFLIDEVNLFCSPEKISDPFKKLIRFGRHHNIGLIYSTQRAPDLHKLLRSQSNKFFLFGQNDPKDVEYLRGYVPNREKILSLPDHHFLYHDLARSRQVIATVDDLEFPAG